MEEPPPADNPYYEIRNSEIHGRGLYARRFIPADAWIVEYLGEKVSKAESERRAVELIENTRENDEAKVFMFILNDEWDIDGGKEWNDARLANHSCEPNVEAQVWDEKEIWFVALRDIQPGEELTFNYGFDLESWEEHVCRCGTKSCPGYIAAEEYWPTLKKKIAAQQRRERRRQKQGDDDPAIAA
jgi:SET domain-containing protein